MSQIFFDQLDIPSPNFNLNAGGQYRNEVEYCHIKDYIMPELAESNPPNDYGLYKGLLQIIIIYIKTYQM